MIEGEFLTPTELSALTGYRRAAEQAQWLDEHGLPCKLDGKRVIVSRHHSRLWLEGKPIVTSKGPNWAAVR